MTKVIIGLEVHTQLQTETKLFCGCPNKFSKEPNIYICDCCLGMPGSKPRTNAKAVELATKIALALNCKISKESFFSRKNYFYPDMSKNFQITQYEIPIAAKGFLVFGKKKIRIGRMQLEEDPARIEHVGGGISEAKYVLVDYNRSGTPLCEIVTDPDFENPAEARDFLQTLASMLEYMGAMDPSVEGSMRVDSNVSIDGGERVEVKNISGFKDVEKALNYEIVRQSSLVKRGEKIKQETRSWDPIAGVTRALRTKETEEDYGYITETDLPMITITSDKIEIAKKSMPEFAFQKVERYVDKMGIEKELAVSITSEADIAQSFENVVKVFENESPSSDMERRRSLYKFIASFYAKQLKKTLNYSNLRLSKTGFKDAYIAQLIRMIRGGEITERAGELLLRDLILKPQNPEDAVRLRNIVRISDEKEIEKFVNQALADNATAVVEYRAGKGKAFEFFVGQVMRKTQGRGDPEVIRKVLEKKLKQPDRSFK